MKKKETLLRRLEDLSNIVYIISEFIQFIFAAIIIIGIIVQLTALPHSLSALIQSKTEGFHEFLEYVIDMVIGVELIHLLCRPNLDNVVEVLLIAITRELVLGTGNALSTLAGVAAIAILFAIRKFLFVDKLDRHDDLFSPDAIRKHMERKSAGRPGRGTAAADAPAGGAAGVGPAEDPSGEK